MPSGSESQSSNHLRNLRENIARRLAEGLEELDTRTAAAETDELLEAALGLSHEQLFLSLSRELDAVALQQVEALVVKRLTGEPLAYVLGEKEFYGRSFFVDKNVLIPRPETELLVERALTHFGESTPRRFLVIDVGTGSGAILFTLMRELEEKFGQAYLEQAQFVAIDLSAAALEVARRNAKRFSLDARVVFVESDLLSTFELDISSFDYLLCLSNPPYISDSAQLPIAVEKFEPILALRSGTEGMDAISALLEQFVALIFTEKIAGAEPSIAADLLIEFGYDQELRVDSMVRRCGLDKYRFYEDLQGVSRVVEIACQKSFV